MAKWNIGAFLRSLTKGAETETPPPAEQAEASQNILTEEMGPVAAESTAVRSELKGALLEVWRQWAGNDLPPVLSLPLVLRSGGDCAAFQRLVIFFKPFFR